jgi:outer membrane receptor protein involved in Fe transport
LRTVQQTSALKKSAPVPLALLVAAVSTALAQEAPSTSGIEEIIVTSQKRTENMQDVPISIQAIGTQRLEEQHVTSFEDYARLLPAVSFQSPAPGFAKVYMRGIVSGGDGNHSGSLPTVGMYLDEQPITTIQGNLDIHVYDIERVEALVGPQGTLYGASSEAGTVRIITNKPDPSGFSASYDIQGNTIADGDPGYVGEGFVNVPISENAAVRLVGWVDHVGGYIDNVPGRRDFPSWGECISNTDPPENGCVQTPATTEDDYNDIDTAGARVALRVDLNENWTITPTIMGQKQESNGFFGFDEGAGELQITHFHPESSEDTWGQAALTVDGTIGNFDLVYAGAYLDRDVDSFSDYVDYAYFYDVVYGYGVYFYDDNGDTIDPSQVIWGKDRYEKQSHELRISSPQDKRFRFVGGLFWQRQVHDIEQRYVIHDLAASNEVTGWPDTFWLTEQIRTDRDEAIFGEFTYDFTDKLAGTAGMRYFTYENSLAGYFGFGLTNSYGSGTGEQACFEDTQINGGPCKNLDATTGKESDSITRLNLTYRFNDDAIMYATWSEGFRPGGINRRGSAYLPDFLTNYEIGWKTTLADGNLRLNGAVFLEEWDDFQFSFLGENSLTQIDNGGSAESVGLDLDFEWAATTNFRLGGGFEVINAELTEPYCEDRTIPCAPPANPPAAPEGQQLPIAPDFKGNLTGRYLFPVGQYDAHAQATVVYVDDRWADLRTVQREILGPMDAYTTVDLTLGIESEHWTVELFALNAFDELAELDRFAQCDATVCGQTSVYVAVVQPRTIGIRFGQRF